MNVYVLTNPSMPGLVKIGRAIAVEQRVEALSSATGVPAPFHIEYEQVVSDAPHVEYLAHSSLALHRLNLRREFFSVSVEDAIKAVQNAALMSAWNKASAEAREEFLSRIDTPVFGRTAGAA